MTTASGLDEQLPPTTTQTTTPALSPAQERLWFLEQLHPGQLTSNVAIALRLRGLLVPKALSQSLTEIVRRHEALRTNIHNRLGRPVSVIVPVQPLPVTTEHLGHLPADQCQVQARQIMEAEVRHPFTLDQGPLLRAKLLKFAPDDHLLILVAHRLAADPVSLGLLYREFINLYRACIEGQLDSPPDLPVSYPEFAFWQRGALENGAFEDQLTYWRQKLQGKLPGLDLPTDHARPSIQTYHQASEHFVLRPDIYPALQALAQCQGTPLSTVLLTALQALLHRTTNQEDILLGLLVPGRTRPETESMIGPLMNSLPLRTSITGETTFQALLAEVHRTETEARDNQELPFESLLQLMPLERDLGRSPLFQAACYFDDHPVSPANLPGLSIRPVRLRAAAALCDLIFTFSKQLHGVAGVVDFNPDLFEPATILRLIGNFQTLLAGVIANPERPIGQLPLLTKAERHQILVDWNRTSVEYPQSACIHQLFEQQAGRTPEAVALVYEDRQLTYRQLNEQADQLAGELRRSGVGPDVRVGICLNRCLEMVVGLYAVHKAGGAYVPLDPSYPAERLAFMLEDAQVPVLLTQSRLRETLPSTAAKIICIDALSANPAPNGNDGHVTHHDRAGNKVSTASVGPDNLAYVIYTSGSTGKPKGVMVRHRNVVNFFTGMDRAIGSEPGVWLALTSICFDISVLELFWTLTRGFKVILHADEAGAGRSQAAQKLRPPPTSQSHSISDQISRHAVTHIQCTPSLASMMVQDPRTKQALRHIRKFFVGGEPLPPALVKQLEGSGELFNMYGPTETTIWSTVHPVTRNSGSILIGRPIANTRIYILDRHLQPVSVGVPGELVIGGDGVVRGYLNRPELTAERFVPDHFSHGPEARLYRTGDLARYKPDGTIQFLGRLDHQVKLRGFRIELGEIAAALCRHADVKESTVSVWEAGPDDKRLVGYLVPKPGAQPQPQELRRFLKNKLPDYMVPSIFMSLESLPLTLNGKINSKALPVPQAAGSTPGPVHQPIQSAPEQAMADVWEDLLYVEQIGLEDNFFDLGGDSHLAAEAHARICERLGIHFPLLRFFEFPTLGALAKHLREEHPARFLPRKTRLRAERQRHALAMEKKNEESGPVSRYGPVCSIC